MRTTGTSTPELWKFHTPCAEPSGTYAEPAQPQAWAPAAHGVTVARLDLSRGPQ